MPELPSTQAAILTADSELIEEVGTDDVPFRLIALRAGVGSEPSPGTTRRASTCSWRPAWIERTIFTRRESESIFDVPVAIREAMEANDRRPDLAHIVPGL